MNQELFLRDDIIEVNIRLLSSTPNLTLKITTSKPIEKEPQSLTIVLKKSLYSPPNIFNQN